MARHKGRASTGKSRAALVFLAVLLSLGCLILFTNHTTHLSSNFELQRYENQQRADSASSPLQEQRPALLPYVPSTSAALPGPWTTTQFRWMQEHWSPGVLHRFTETCGDWVALVNEWQARVRKQRVAGGAAPPVVAYACWHNHEQLCSGFNDRLIGTQGALSHAVALGLPYRIVWKNLARAFSSSVFLEDWEWAPNGTTERLDDRDAHEDRWASGKGCLIGTSKRVASADCEALPLIIMNTLLSSKLQNSVLNF